MLFRSIPPCCCLKTIFPLHVPRACRYTCYRVLRNYRSPPYSLFLMHIPHLGVLHRVPKTLWSECMLNCRLQKLCPVIHVVARLAGDPAELVYYCSGNLSPNGVTTQQYAPNAHFVINTPAAGSSSRSGLVYICRTVLCR